MQSLARASFLWLSVGVNRQRRTVIGAVALAGLAGALVVLADPLAATWWGWRAQSDLDPDAWLGCGDPGTTQLLATVQRGLEPPCTLTQWLPHLAEDLDRIGASRWAGWRLAEADASPTLRLRLGLALAVRGESDGIELSGLLMSEQVPVDDRDAVLAALAVLDEPSGATAPGSSPLTDGDELPPWVDPGLQHAVVAAAFGQRAALPAEAVAPWLERQQVAPRALPDALAAAALARVQDLLDSGRPPTAEGPTCLEGPRPLSCLADVAREAEAQDTWGWDGGPVEPQGNALVLPASMPLLEPLWAAHYADDEASVAGARWWLDSAAVWFELHPDALFALLASPWQDRDSLAPGALGEPAAVVGQRGGAPWATALTARALAGDAVEVRLLPGGVQLTYGVQHRDLQLCPGDDAPEPGSVLSDEQLLAGTAAEAAAGALARGDEARALRLAGLAERTDPSRWGGLAASISGADTQPTAALGAAIGGVQTGASPAAAWVEAWRSYGVSEDCSTELYAPG